MELAATVDWIQGDATEMAALLREASADDPVPTCPGWTAADLSSHLATAFGAWYTYNISTPADQWTPDDLMARFGRFGVNGHDASVAEFEAGVTEFVGRCSGPDLDMDTWSFGGVEPARWWIRRAGTELTVHLTDAASIRGRRVSTSAEGHAEAIDELITEIFPRLNALETFASAIQNRTLNPTTPPEQPVTLVASDIDRSWTLERGADGVAQVTRGASADSAAVGSGSSSEVLAWLHGRPVANPLTIDGNVALLDEWNLFHRTEAF